MPGDLGLSFPSSDYQQNKFCKQEHWDSFMLLELAQLCQCKSGKFGMAKFSSLSLASDYILSSSLLSWMLKPPGCKVRCEISNDNMGWIQNFLSEMNISLLGEEDGLWCIPALETRADLSRLQKFMGVCILH